MLEGPREVVIPRLILVVTVFVLVVFGLVAVNTFGAWAVSRRKPWVARLFLLAAMILTVTIVAYGFRVDYAFWLLLAGVIASALASILNAALVIGKFAWPNHLLRTLVLALIVIGARFFMP